MSDTGSDSPSGRPTKKLKEQRKTGVVDMSKMKGGAPDPDSDEEYYCPPGVKRMDREKWEKYEQQIEESEGFDIIDYPGDCPFVSVVPLRNLSKNPDEAQDIEEAATLAIQEFNKQNSETKYEFVKVEKANARVCAGTVFYITFQAKERRRDNPAVKTFQAKVWEKIPHTEKEVKFCRIKKISANSQDEAASDLPQ